MKRLGSMALTLLVAAGCDGPGTTAPGSSQEIETRQLARPAVGCRNVRGTGLATLIDPITAEGTLQGDLDADLRVTRTDLVNHGLSALHSDRLFLPASIHVQRWEFETSDPDGVFEGADFSGVTEAKVGPIHAAKLTAIASARVEIMKGGHGQIVVRGVVDFSGIPTLDFRYHGRLCGV